MPILRETSHLGGFSENFFAKTPPKKFFLGNYGRVFGCFIDSYTLLDLTSGRNPENLGEFFLPSEKTSFFNYFHLFSGGEEFWRPNVLVLVNHILGCILVPKVDRLMQ